MDVDGMKMLRWVYGVAKMDRTKNEKTRGTVKFTEISTKIQEMTVVAQAY